MLWDTHMHTLFSGDSESTVESMIQSAIENELDGICFTDHIDYDYPNNPGLFLFDLNEYTTCMENHQKQYAHLFPIRIGVELGLQPQIAEWNRNFVSQYDFDFVIGSSHVVHGFDPYYPDYYEGKTEQEAYREYFESILENITAFDDFDVFGHIDYVVRYGPTKNENYSYEQYADVIDEILRQLIEKGKGIELNTAGLKYGLGHPNPTEAILKHYRELGGEILTIGSDAHRPEHIAYDFEKVPHFLEQAGFEYYTVFEKRKAVFYKI